LEKTVKYFSKAIKYFGENGKILLKAIKYFGEQ